MPDPNGSDDLPDVDLTHEPADTSTVPTGGATEGEPAQESTTAPGQDDDYIGYVGRIAGDDVGYAGKTGAEVRAEAEDSA